MVGVISDSTADLGPALAQRFQIQIIPFLVHVGEQTFRDGIDLGAEGIYRFVDETGELPKTAAAPVAAYLAGFQSCDQSVYIGISSKLSIGVQNARLAAQSLPEGRTCQARVVDSLNLSTGTGLLALLAADLRDQGCTLDEVERAVLAAVPRVRTSFVVDTLRFLYMGGRCTAVQSIASSVLKIRPVIAVSPDGTLGIKEKVRGTRKRALQSLLDDLAAHLPELDRRRVFVTHSGCVEDAAFLAKEVARLTSPDEVLVTQAGCTVSSHCGPNTIGILYMVKG